MLKVNWVWFDLPGWAVRLHHAVPSCGPIMRSHHAVPSCGPIVDSRKRRLSVSIPKSAMGNQVVSVHGADRLYWEVWPK